MSEISLQVILREPKVSKRLQHNMILEDKNANYN